MDLINATELVNSVITSLSHIIQNAQDEFKVRFSELRSVASKLGIQLQMPRVAKRCIFRATAETADGDVESFYRVNVFIPTVDAVLQDLKDRFSRHQQTAFII